jgi:hypothetical protein
MHYVKAAPQTFPAYKNIDGSPVRTCFKGAFFYLSLQDSHATQMSCRFEAAKPVFSFPVPIPGSPEGPYVTQEVKYGIQM